MRSRLMAAAAFPTMRGSPRPMPASVRCGSPTARMRCITAPLPDLNFGSIKTPQGTNGSLQRGAPQYLEETRKTGSVSVAEGVRKDEEFSGTREVEERHRVNEANLAKWM